MRAARGVSVCLWITVGLSLAISKPVAGQSCTAPDFPTYVAGPAGTAPWDMVVGEFTKDAYPDLAVVNRTIPATVTILRGFDFGFAFLIAPGFPDGIRDVAVADFNHDGWTDLAVSGETSGEVFVRLGNAVGDFGGVTPYPVEDGPTAIVTDDFNRDGHPDIAVANTASGTVSILLGDGGGGFTVLSGLNMPVDADMVAADVNMDGRPDLIGVLAPGDRFLVALGNGDGTFKIPVAFPAGTRPLSLLVRDFDKNGTLDVVTVDNADRQLTFHAGDGLGGFTLAGSYPAGGGDVQRVAAGDFNGDGILDLATADLGGSEVGVLLGRGDGSFQDPVLFPVDEKSYDVLAGDFNLDGRDNIVVSAPNVDEVRLLRNAFGFPCPNPSFAKLGRFLPGAAQPRAIAVLDYTVDGSPDVASANDASNNVSLWKGFGDGELQADPGVSMGTTPVSVATGDFNGDGIPDIVTANRGSSNATVRLGNGSGFPNPTTYALPGQPAQVVAADVSFDGKVDLVFVLTAASNNVQVRLNDGSGGFAAFANYSVGANPTAAAVGDLDNDLLPEIAVGEPANRVSILSNTGGGSFALTGSVPTAGPVTAVAAARMNGDANLDIVVASGTTAPAARLQVFLGDGLLGFTPGANLLLGGSASSPHGLAVDDFNVDGRLDVAAVASEASRVRVLLGNGGGAFSALLSIVTGEPAAGIATGDLNRDGRPDLLATQPSRQGLWAMFGDGAGGFSPDFYPSTFADNRSVDTGDFDKKGMLDLVVANADDDSVSVFLGQGGGTFAGPIISSIAPGAKPQWVTSGDFDRDGVLDVVASAEGSLELVFLPGNGDGSFGGASPSPTNGGAPYINRAADFDLDGILDIAVIVGTEVELHQGDGTGKFIYRTSLGLGGLGSGLVLRDFNRDGLMDVAATQTTDNIVIVFFASKTLPFTWTFPSGFNRGLPPSPADFDVADMNEDGVLDFIVPSTTNSRISFVLSNGPASWDASAVVLAGPLTPVALRAADINRDGLQDFVVASRGDHFLSFYTGDGAGGITAQPGYPAVLREPRWLALGDFDMDSLPDVALVPDTGSSGLGIAGVSVVLNTNCKSRVLFPEKDVSTCDTPGAPFSSQPRLLIRDDGRNPILCETQPVVAGIRPGTGTPGASLLGTTSVAPTIPSDAVGYTNLAVDVGGGGYQLQYTHPTARRFLSRRFSQAPTVTITGPAAICEGAAALYDVGPGYDTHMWTLDAAPLASMASAVDLTGALAPGLRDLAVSVTRDSCSASDLLTIDVTANLVSVTVTPGGPITVCDVCTGPLASAALVGGGASTFQWGYRTTPGGAITSFAGETGATYSIEGGDFPGGGTYYLVVTVTPTCGTPLVSNEAQVDITNATALEPLVILSARSTDAESLLEWATPPLAPCNSIRILRRDDGVFPLDPNDTTTNFWVGGSDFACPPSGKDFFSDTTVVNDTTYHYAAYISDGTNFSTRTTITARPFDSSIGNVRWAYSTAAASMGLSGLRIQPGATSLYITSNDYFVHGLDADGRWLPSAKPYRLVLPSQVRPPAVDFAVGSGPSAGANGAVFVTSQDGAVRALDADELDEVWVQDLEENFQAAAAASFANYGGRDLVLVGTRNGVAPNGLAAYDVNDGTYLWTFQNLTGPQNGDGTPVGIVLASAAVEYTNQRAYFGSWLAGSYSVWAVDISGPTPQFVWGSNLGDVEASPIYINFGPDPERVIIANKNGDVHLLDASSGLSLWGGSFYNAGDGGVKNFVFPQFHPASENYMFSTINKVVSIRHQGVGFAPTLNWEIATIPSPSSPLFLPNTTTALVGGGDGRLYQINGVDTPSPTLTFVVLGDGTAAVGSPAFDVVNDRITVGTDAGNIYAVDYPLP